MPLVVTSATGTSTFADPVAGFTRIANDYWESHNVGAPEYERIEPSWAGVDGVGVKRMGFRRRQISFTVCIVGATEAAVMTAYEAHITKMKNVKCSISIPNGATYPACELLPDSRPQKNPKVDEGAYYMSVDFEFEQKRLT